MDDNMHGYKSANKLDFLKSVVNYDELQSIKTIIICHCLESDEYDLILKINNIKNPELVKKILLIVKDIDALDRVREYPYCDTKYIKNRTALKLLPFACILFNSYKIIVGDEYE